MRALPMSLTSVGSCFTSLFCISTPPLSLWADPVHVPWADPVHVPCGIARALN